MKAISLFKLLTVVSFFVAGVQVHAANEGETRDACKIRVANAKKAEVEQTCKDRTTTTTDDKGNKKDIPLTAGEFASCKKTESDILINAECGELETQKDKKSECKQALKEYDEAIKKTNEECNNLNVKDTQECRDKAGQCSKDLNSFQSSGEEDDSETTSGAFTKLIGLYGQMQGASAAASGNGAGGCLIENDEKAAEKEERIDDKITRLREEIQDLKEKATEADKEFNDKKNEVENEMQEAQKAADKAKFEKQTKNQEEAGRMQKAIMASEKKRKDNLVKIADLQVELANFSFAHQKLNLALSDAKIAKDCREKATAMLTAKLKGTVDPKTGKEINKPRFTLQQSAQFKKDLKLEESNCLQEKILQKQETAKALMDSKRKMNVQITTLTESNADEAKAIENEIKQMEALKTIAAEEEKKDIENNLKRLNTLNQSVVDMEKHIADKKKSFDEKSKAKEDQINKLILDRQNVKSRFAKVSSVVSTSSNAASNFVNQCCKSSVKTENHTECGRVTDLEPETLKQKTYKAPKARK